MHWLIDSVNVACVNGFILYACLYIYICHCVLKFIEIDDDGGADVGATPTPSPTSTDNKKVLQELDANKIVIDNQVQHIQKCGAVYSLFQIWLNLLLQISSSNKSSFEGPDYWCESLSDACKIHWIGWMDGWMDGNELNEMMMGDLKDWLTVSCLNAN